MFIGKKQELNFLEERYKNNSGQLIVLYGRCHIGKTETSHPYGYKKLVVIGELPYICKNNSRW